MMNLRLLNQGGLSTSEAGMSRQLPSLRLPTFDNGAASGFMANMGEPLDYDQGNNEDDDAQVNNVQPASHSEEEPHL